MSSSRSWDRQKREIQSYNNFLSSYHSRASYHGFSELGFVISNHFPTVSDPYSDVVAEPDFILYDGETAILSEVKQGNNITQRHIKQARFMDSVTIQGLEEFLQDSQVEERFGFEGEVFQIEILLVYDGMDEEYIANCRENWPDCREKLTELEKVAPVLGQETSGRLRILAGQFDSSNIQKWLEYGIQLPETPRITISLTDNLELESIAVTLCRIWGERAVSSDVSVTVNQVRRKFDHRELAPGAVRDAFEFLTEVGACEQTGEHQYTFSPDQMSTILDIERIISEENSDDGQKDLGSYL